MDLKQLLNFFPKGHPARKYIKREAFADGKFSKSEYSTLISKYGMTQNQLNSFTKKLSKYASSNDEFKIGKGLKKQGKRDKLFAKKATAQNIPDKLIAKADTTTGYKNQSDKFQSKVTKRQFRDLRMDQGQLQDTRTQTFEQPDSPDIKSKYNDKGRFDFDESLASNTINDMAANVGGINENDLRIGFNEDGSLAEYTPPSFDRIPTANYGNPQAPRLGGPSKIDFGKRFNSNPSIKEPKLKKGKYSKQGLGILKRPKQKKEAPSFNL